MPFHENSLGHAAERAFLPQITAWTLHTREELRNCPKPVLLTAVCSVPAQAHPKEDTFPWQHHDTVQLSTKASGQMVPLRTVWRPSSGRRKPFHRPSHLCGRPGQKVWGWAATHLQLLLDTHYSSPSHKGSVLQLWTGPRRHSRLGRELNSHMFLSQPVSPTGMGISSEEGSRVPL